jgi:hypothetical protein
MGQEGKKKEKEKKWHVILIDGIIDTINMSLIYVEESINSF